MPRLKYKKKGKRVNVWIPAKNMKIAAEIDNLSSFLQIALDNAADIMAWAILQDVDPKKFSTNTKVEDVIDEFNQKYPLNDLTQRRITKETWQTNSQKLPDVLS